VKNYLELQKIRFKDKFDYSVSVGTNIAPDTQVPKMIIQTFAENAVKHGLMHRMKDGRLDIIVENADTCLQIVIEDNGVGRERAVELNTGSTGKGLKIINQIVALYKKLYNTEITQEIIDLTDENGNSSGTRVILHICFMKVKGNKLYLFKKRNI
jgi:LytS/YehU family sensor histidine kinase